MRRIHGKKSASCLTLPLRGSKAGVKGGHYEKAHAGLPLVQHSLLLMLYYYKQGKYHWKRSLEKMSHTVADCFQIKERGYIREGYHADLVIVDMNKPQ